MTTLLSQFAANDLPTDGVLHQEPISISPTDDTNKLSIRNNTSTLDRQRSRLQNSFNSDILVEGREEDDEQHVDEDESKERPLKDSRSESNKASEKNEDNGSRSSFDY